MRANEVCKHRPNTDSKYLIVGPPYTADTDLALDYLPSRGIVGGCRMGTGWDQVLIDQTFYPPTQLLITHLKPSVNRYPA